jgi:ribose 1,5-bisphosphate isomerase
MDVDSAVEKIRSMEVRGAGRIARFAVSTVSDQVSKSDKTDLADLKSDLMKIFQTLNASRPTAVSLKNSLRYIYQHSLAQFQEDKGTAEDLRNRVMEACSSFIEKSEGAVKKIGELGSDRIQDGSTLQTHCNSQLALSAIIEAHNQGKSIKVFASESRPWYQGHLTVRELAEANVHVTLIVDSAVRYFMEKVDAVFVGADTILADGELINKIGTSQIALAAKEFGVPFYVCAETYKFSPDSLFNPDHEVIIEERDPAEVVPDQNSFKGINIANPVFDRTPPEYITEYITEIGAFKPSKVKELIESEFGTGEVLDFDFES